MQAAPLIAGLAVAAAALASRYSIQAWHAYKARPIVPRMRKFYEGGFQPAMTRREAGLILGVRYISYKSIICAPHLIIIYVTLSIQLFICILGMCFFFLKYWTRKTQSTHLMMTD